MHPKITIPEPNPEKGFIENIKPGQLYEYTGNVNKDNWFFEPYPLLLHCKKIYPKTGDVILAVRPLAQKENIFGLKCYLFLWKKRFLIVEEDDCSYLNLLY